MLHSDFIQHIETICSKVEGTPTKLSAYEKVYGGETNQIYRLATTKVDYFIKVNTADKAPMFAAEAKGLKILSATDSFETPKVFETGIFNEVSFLLMTFIPSLEDVSNPKLFAKNLVKMHQNTQAQFGLDFDNFIGELPQKNTLENNWSDFYTTHRLLPQIALAQQKNLLPTEINKQLEQLLINLPELLPNEQPALLHGDLWNGNYFYNLQGNPVLFDPAIYFGHREMDLAMMHLFGGFDKQIFEIYNALFPLENNWKQRIPLYQLYPLLVHLNLFGESYLASISQIIKSY